MSNKVVPFCLKDAPALIERLLPVQKLSAESYKEQMAVHGKTLTALGSYWKGRKPLILNKACVLGCLLPATGNDAKDLAIFEKLMAMDDASMMRRLEDKNDKASKLLFAKQRDLSESAPYREWVYAASRPEECGETLFDDAWPEVNAHLGTNAKSFPDLVGQLGIMRYGHRPRVADTFSGSGQIPFEAARLGCDVVASDLNPVACMLTWGGFNVVGAPRDKREELKKTQELLVAKVRSEIDALGVEEDGKGWRTKVFLYCVEAKCPESGWMVPLLPSRVISTSYGVVADLVPDLAKKRYDIKIRSGVGEKDLEKAAVGTVQSGGKGQDPFLVHTVNGKECRSKISTIRGDYRAADGTTGNKLRQWEVQDIVPRKGDIYQERLYAVQWMRQKKGGARFDYQFRSVTEEDLRRDAIVESFVKKNLAEWQLNGWIPNARIEPGDETERLYRERGWTHWHHLFTPRQLLLAGLVNRYSAAEGKFVLTQILNWNSRLCIWSIHDGGGGAVKNTFMNQALNTLFNYGCRGFDYAQNLFDLSVKSFDLGPGDKQVINVPAGEIEYQSDIFITDPPYGDAVKYEEILDFFIAWLRTSPPAAFSKWTWDARRAIAIKGEDEGFRRGMVSAYRRMSESMPDNGIQIVMFTHQSGAIWADMANIVWASGLQVTAAWYVVTETDSALRDGANVKGTVLLVLRKRSGIFKTSRDELGYEIQEEVEKQISDLTGLNQAAKGLYRDANVFEDADVQMAGYAAALRVLTRYAVIDGKDMPAEALRPRVKGETTFVDKLITFAVDTANQCLVPEGLEKSVWDALSGPERFYLKLLELEAKSIATLDNYQNFAKAFKVADFQPLMASAKANKGRLRSAKEFKAAEMGEGSQLYQSPLRCMLYAIKELMDETDGDDVIKHLALNVPSYYDQATRDVILAVADYLAAKLERLRPDEASSARVLRDLVRNQRIG